MSSIMAMAAPDYRQLVGGNIVRARRLAGGVSQQQLGKQLRIDPRQISEWERGVHLPTHRNLQRLADALDQPFFWFYTPHDDDA